MTSTDLRSAEHESAEPATFAHRWKAWHVEHERARAGRHGFLAVTGLHWLNAEPQRFADAPGEWWTDADGAHVRLADGESLELDGQTVTGAHHLGVLPERGGVLLTVGDVVIEVARRGGYYIVRPRNPEHPLRTGYAGTPTFAPDERFAVAGRFRSYDTPTPTKVGAAVEGLEHVYDAPGDIEFELDGSTYALVAFPGHGDGDLLVLFTDATSGVTTYAANRALHVDAPGTDARVVLDFNRATNLPCAYTDYATCPLPPEQNRLPVAVEAGERIPIERGGRW